MNIYLVIILVILIGKYILDLVVDILNVKNAVPVLPKEFEGYYDADKYKKSQVYLRENINFGIIKDTLFAVITVAFILMGGFNIVDKIARGFGYGEIITGLIFAAILVLAIYLMGLPFSIYDTFVIEEKYGFNKTTAKTFVLDILKGLLLGAIIGGIVFTGILWFFGETGKWAWVCCWGGVTVFMLFMAFIAPVVILPLFNKFIPLEDGELKQEIEKYAARENFKLKGIFKMDASRRSTKSNAFFIGFGKYKRIVLYDTLIAKHTVDELVCVLAHEIGHYKKKHFIKGITMSILTMGLMFYILSLFINNEGLFAAFKMEQTSIYASLFFFGFLYTPISMILSIFGNIISRKYEYQADAYAVLTHKKPESFITALKKLVVENLSNLTPHPLKVFLDYTHPPVLKRIEAIRNQMVKDNFKGIPK
ncbi:MAG: M48 family metallopeptidase [Planctomycetota bacterium]